MNCVYTCMCMCTFEQINKPFLPIASKALSSQSAWKIVISCLLLGSYNKMYVCSYVCVCDVASSLSRCVYSEDNIFSGDIFPIYGGCGARDALLGAAHAVEAIPLARYVCMYV